MKASELNAKAGDIIGDGFTAGRVSIANGVMRVQFIGGMWFDVKDVHGTDWQLLTPSPEAVRWELGEPVDMDDVEAGERVLVRHASNSLISQGHGTGANVIYLWCGSAFIASTGDIIYRDPRPLPALPPREPSLREKVTKVIRDMTPASIGRDHCSEIADRIAALLKEGAE